MQHIKTILYGDAYSDDEIRFIVGTFVCKENFLLFDRDEHCNYLYLGHGIRRVFEYKLEENCPSEIAEELTGRR